jgi:hypothetical protein
MPRLDAVAAGSADAASLDRVGTEAPEESRSGEPVIDGGAELFPRLIEIVPLIGVGFMAGEGRATGTFASEDTENCESPRGLVMIPCWSGEGGAGWFSGLPKRGVMGD